MVFLVVGPVRSGCPPYTLVNFKENSCILPAITAKQCIKLDILATSLLYSMQISSKSAIYNIKKAIGG